MTFFIVGKIEIVNYIQNLSELYPHLSYIGWHLQKQFLRLLAG